MHRFSGLFFVCFLPLCLGTWACKSAPADAPKDKAEETMPKAITYPPTEQIPATLSVHGTSLEDPFQWLEDEKSQATVAWMKAQDGFTRQMLASLPQREKLAKRFKELYYIEAISAPRRHGDRFFLYRRGADQEKYSVYWKQGKDGEEKLLIDPSTFSKDGTAALGGFSPSQDGKYVAYKVNENAADEATMYIMEVDTGKVSPTEVFPFARYAEPSWLPNHKGFYYTNLPKDPSVSVQDRPGLAEVRYHELGTDPAKDPIVVPRSNDPKKFVYVGTSRDGRYLFYIEQFGWTKQNVHWRRAGEKEWSPFAVGKDALFNIEAHKDELFISTNLDAPNQKIMKLAIPKKGLPTIDQARQIIAEQPDFVIEDMRLIGGKLVLNGMRQAHGELHVYDLKGQKIREVELPDIGSVTTPQGEPDKPEAYFTFVSYTTPNQVYETNLKTGETSLFASINVPVDASKFETRQVMVESKDGTKVSMFVVQKKGFTPGKDAPVPFILYGYGGFSVSMTPYFWSSIYPWLEAGGGFAVANLRGGGEFGESWHRAGMREKKQNVFDDFIAAGEHLINQGYTTSPQLGIQGGSNGGLLVGAVMTQRPDLFGAVMCSVPLLDMVRFHLYGSGKTWVAEYGDPEVADEFKYLLAYSPYHRIEPGQTYPPLLMLSADHDDRVDPFHARKMVARLQAQASGGPFLLHIEQDAGHGGADMVQKRVEKDVDKYSFLMSQLGLEWE